MSELRVGIFGCGRMGKERARCARALGATIAAAYDPLAERSEAMAAGSGSRSVSALDDFPWGDVDAVFFCTPPDSRETLALAAVDAGVPFLAEKPVGVSHQAAERVLSALSRSRVVNAIGYMNRCRSSILHARAQLQFTRVLGVTGFWVCRKYAVPWWLDPGASGGPVNEQATHLFDLCRFLVGEIAEVSARPARGTGDELTLGCAGALQFKSGAIGTVFYSCESSGKDIGLHVFTDRGSIALSGWEFQMTVNSIDGTMPASEDEDIFLKETAAFLQAVRVGDPSAVPCDWAEAMRTQSAVDAVRRALTRSAQKETVLA